MLNMIKGCKISNPSILYEGYEKIKGRFIANVHADKMQCLFEAFVQLHNEMCFFVLEVPTNAKEEPAVQDETSSLHKDVYYLDGLTPERAVEFLNVFAPWLIHDGMSSFGFGIHSGGHEPMSGKYNVVTLFTREPDMYENFFESLNIPKVNELKTAWDYFTPESPGEAFRYIHEGNDIYDLIAHMKQYGLYFAERREA